MSRLGVLYALNEDELNKLRSIPQEERYNYMLDEIEELLLKTARGCELVKAWEGIQYCLGGGVWNEENSVPTNIVFGGEFLVETDDEIITLKNYSDVVQIVTYLRQNNLHEIIRKNFPLIDEQEYTLPKNDDNLNYLLDWSRDILSFYENAQKERCSVIFTVDL
ncbi:DUF1877 family protein [Bacteroides congonensis]|jgi:hypothetical protein|uniref:DUF1877 family protein n=1 Tax=Bacteroides congonensis TaxID=1871006 RepID=UPI000933EADB|nr:DUF1877 family protein [Bacteroides congonensis]